MFCKFTVLKYIKKRVRNRTRQKQTIEDTKKEATRLILDGKNMRYC
jgi:hypothetical protein